MSDLISKRQMVDKIQDLFLDKYEEKENSDLTGFFKEVLKILVNDKGQSWISVKDRLPEIGKSVLIYYPKWDGDEIQVAKLEDDGMMFDICGEFNIGTGVVTHWMPLPQKPKSEDDKGKAYEE